MAKLVTEYLDKYSQAMTGHKGWTFLDHMTKEEQLKVIQNYNENVTKYIVVVFERNEEIDQHIDHSDEAPHTEEMEEYADESAQWGGGPEPEEPNPYHGTYGEED